MKIQVRKQSLLKEFSITTLIKITGYSAILFVAMSFVFMLLEGLPALRQVELESLLSDRWYPVEDHFGILPLLGGSLLITLGATLIAVPFGVGTAVYLSEIAPRWLREILKPLIEVLGGLPSVVLGFLGMLVLSPYLRVLLDLPTGLSALAGAVLLGGIAIPTVVSVAEDALDAVPRSYRDASLAMGATEWQTIWRYVVARYGAHAITWLVCGEYNASMGDSAGRIRKVLELGQFIKDMTVYCYVRHLV